MDFGYGRVSTTKQDLERQLHALQAPNIALSGLTSTAGPDRTPTAPDCRPPLAYARDGDVIVVNALDRLGRTVRDTLHLIHELGEHGIGVRHLADPIRVDSANPDDPMACWRR